MIFFTFSRMIILSMALEHAIFTRFFSCINPTLLVTTMSKMINTALHLCIESMMPIVMSFIQSFCNAMVCIACLYTLNCAQYKVMISKSCDQITFLLIMLRPKFRATEVLLTLYLDLLASFKVVLWTCNKKNKNLTLYTVWKYLAICCKCG